MFILNKTKATAGMGFLRDRYTNVKKQLSAFGGVRDSDSNLIQSSKFYFKYFIITWFPALPLLNPNPPASAPWPVVIKLSSFLVTLGNP